MDCGDSAAFPRNLYDLSLGIAYDVNSAANRCSTIGSGRSSKRRLGVHFRRQVVVGGFIVDFLAPSVKLVVEVDGGVHARKRVADARRERKLRRLGYRVVRVTAEEERRR